MDRRIEQMRELNKTSVLIAAALFTIIPLLGFVLWIMLQDTAAEDLSSLSEMFSIIVVMGAIVVVTIPLSFWVTRVLLKSGAARAASGTVTPLLQRFAVDGKVEPLDGVAANMMVAHIAAAAVSEVAVQFGFVLSIMMGTWVFFAGGAALTALLWAIHFPRFSRWERLLEAERDRLQSAPRIVG